MVGTGVKASLASPADESRFDSSKPQFRKTSNQVSKVVLDERFASVLTDPRFQLATADKYGRKQSTKKSNDVENLTEFYTIEGERDGHASNVTASKRLPTDDVATECSTEAEPFVSAGDDKAAKGKRDGPKLSEKDSDDPASRIAFLTALSRGEVDVSSSSDDESGGQPEDDDSDNGVNSVADEEAIGVLDPSSNDIEQIEMTTEESPYMAVMNMDWSHVRAVDIFTILSSFTPAGAVKRVQVYPSDFGMERMKKEQLFGPVDVWRKARASNGTMTGQGLNDDIGKDSSIDYDDEESDDANGEEGDNSDLDSDSPNDTKATDFDPEKLRRYEAARLKYYFAVVEFASPQHADIAYKQVDGMEFEHSSAAIDLRSIPINSLDDVRENRELRDEATMIPSTYVPPEFVVNALQQSTVQCTWDMGNQDRESLLTKYQSGPTWSKVTDNDDLKVYLASDNSSDEESGSDEENEKGAKMRKMLGLDSDNEENDEEGPNDEDSDLGVDGSGSENGSSVEEGNKQVRFIPEESDLASKLREKLATKSTVSDDLTPWEKYQEKRKQKKREKRAAAREKRKEITCIRKNGGVSGDEELNQADDFFVDSGADASVDKNDFERTLSNPREQLPETLLSDRDDSDDERDFDMRGLERIEKNKEKKLHGARKRKEDKLTANVTGSDFKVDTTDERFMAVLEGADDRFGIDRTDPSFRETPAMREILAEQSRRKKRRKLPSDSGANSGESKPSSASATLTELANRIKKKVS
jgi:hypothetical protein